MDKPRSMVKELFVITLIIIIASVVIWNIDMTPKATKEEPKETNKIAAETKSISGKGTESETRWSEGKSLFKSNCASCHNPKVAQTGPALLGVTKRWEDAGSYKGKTGKKWLYAWIKNWNDPVAAAYPYAVSMSNYSPSQMNVFPTLKDEDIDKILLYVEEPDARQAVP
jgi:mono/diheme cytochrome c family protein